PGFKVRRVHDRRSYVRRSVFNGQHHSLANRSLARKNAVNCESPLDTRGDVVMGEDARNVFSVGVYALDVDRDRNSRYGTIAEAKRPADAGPGRELYRLVNGSTA